MFSHLPEPGRTGLCVSTENYRRHKSSSKVKTIIITIDESLIFRSQIKAIFKKSKSKIRFFLSLYHTKQQCTIMQGKNNITVESLPPGFNVMFSMMGYMSNLHGQRKALFLQIFFSPKEFAITDN